MDIIDTSFELVYDLFDTTAIADSDLSCTQNKSFADIDDLNTGTNYAKYMTLEHNFSVLDGTIPEMPDTIPNVSYFSLVKANAGEGFTTNPYIQIDFDDPHSMIGLELDFADFYPLEMVVSWYNYSGDLVDMTRVHPDKLHYVLFHPVQNFFKLVIEFTRVMPGHYIKLNKITYGIRFDWDESTVIDANLVTEGSIISDKISINTLSFSIYDEQDYFNLGNAQGIHPYVQSGQVVDAYENIRGEKVYLGRKFIDKFTTQDGKVKFTCNSYVGVLDKVDYHNGDIYSNGITAGDLIDDIMSVAGITDYSVDQEVADVVLYGTLKPGTCRECLREVLFATQASINTSGISGIEIYKRSKYIIGKVGRDRKISTKVTKKDYVSGVGIKYKTYTLDTSAEGTEDIVTGLYDEGENLITWDAPHDSVTASSGTITESGKYYCILELTALEAENEITISGTKYIENEIVYYKKAKYLSAGQQENIKTFSGSLLNGSLAKQVASAIYSYYEYLLQVDIKYLADNESYKNQIVVQNSDESYNDYITQFEKISYDLTGGYIATATLVGYYNVDSGYYYADSADNTDLRMSDSLDGGLI